MSDRIPDAARTREVLSKILSEMGPKRTEDPPWLQKFFDAVGNFIKGLSTAAWVLLIAGLSVITALIIYRIVSRARKRDKALTRGRAEEIAEDEFLITVSSAHYFEIAEQQAGNSQYSEGIVSLYRASIASLIENGMIIEQTGATNREIRRKIRSNERCLDCFTVLSGFSEHILFNDEVLNEPEYQTARETYIRGFVNK